MKLNEIIDADRIPVGQGGPYLYHVTGVFELKGMLTDGAIGTEGEILSMSRDPEYFVGGGDATGWDAIQIVLNRKNLEETHAVEPHTEVWKDDHGEEVGGGESEERIWEHPVPFTKNYVVQVKTRVQLETPIIKKLNKLGIPLVNLF